MIQLLDCPVSGSILPDVVANFLRTPESKNANSENPLECDLPTSSERYTPVLFFRLGEYLQDLRGGSVLLHSSKPVNSKPEFKGDA